MKNLLILLSFMIWVGSSHICDYFYPTNSEYDVNGYWELKKILSSVVIFLLLISIDKLKSFISIIFSAYIVEDIVDRFFGTTKFEWNDFLVLILTLIILTVKTYKNAHSNKNNTFYINNLFRNKRNE